VARLFSDEWAQAAQARLATGFTEQDKAGKLGDYWDWVAAAASSFTGSLALGVLPARGSKLTEGEFAVIDIANGQVQAVRPADAAQAEAADYCLVGTYDGWRQFAAGYDPGKTIMYRLLRLERGNLLSFFNRVYYWVELVGLLQQVPTEVPEPAPVTA
jgi:hypothetical protein